MADRDLLGCTLGDYVLRELIGKGGYGEVYRGEQPALEREVVVKVLHAQRTDNDSRERFLREARLAAQLDHLYAAHVYDFGAEDEGDVLWIAMERVRGVPLDAWLSTHGPMPPEQLGPFFEAVCEVVHAAHEVGIVHRDLKPSNIMVVESRGLLLPKLLDFGIAKWNRPSEVAPDPGSEEGCAPDRDEVKTKRLPVRPRRAGRKVICHDSEIRRQLTPPGGCLGSPPYMAPEQRRGADGVGPEADIYGLGVVAYEMLTARLPFVADRTDDYFEQHQRAPVPRLGDGFPPALDQVIQRALDKNPRARFGTALELAAALRRALRASMREQLRTSAQQWHEQCAPSGLLWGADVLEDALRSVPRETLSPLECSFVAESQRRIRRARWARRLLVALAAAIAVGGLLYRAAMQTQLAEEQARTAREVSEATVTQAELEQGRSALLHGEPDACLHLSLAYQRGDRSPSTAFMLARALQPRLAEQARLPSSSGRMWSAMFSPDGTRVVTTDEISARIWNAQTKQLLFTLRHADTVYHSVFNSDGTRLITAGADGVVRIWDTTSGSLVHQLQRDGMKPRYYVVAMSPDDTLVAAIGLGGTATYVWNAASGALVAELRQDASDGPSLAFSPDGHWLATTGGNARVFDTKTWAEVHVIQGPGIRSVSWDPSGPRLATGSANGDASIWSIPTGARLHHLHDVGEPIQAVAFSPNGRLVVAATREGGELVWNASTGTLQSSTNQVHSRVLSVEFDHSSTLVVAAAASGAVAITDAVSGMPVTVLDGPRNVVKVAHFDPSARRVVGASWDGTARIWDATAPYHKWSSAPVSDDCGLVTSLEPDRRFLAVGCRNHPTRVWDTAHDQLLAELPSVTPAGGDFESAYPAVSAEGDRAAIARGNTVDVYELPGGHLLRKIAHAAPVSTVAFTASGRDIVSGAVDGSLLVTRDNGAALSLPASSGGIDAAGFLPDGRIVAADARLRLRLYSATGEILADLKMSARARTLRMSANGHRLVTVPSFMGKAASPELWDVGDYRQVAQLDGQGAQIFSARFVGDDVLTAWSDGAARLWDGTTGQLRRTYPGGPRHLVDVTLSSNGSMVVGGDGDGVLRFWDAASTRPLWTMSAHRSHLVGVRVDGNEVITRGFSGDISRWALPDPERILEACSQHDRCAIVLR